MPTSVLGDVPGDPGHGVDDVSGEKSERAEDGDRDHCEHDAILRHRLPLLTLSQRSEQVKKLQHLFHLPSASTRGKERIEQLQIRAGVERVGFSGHAGGTSVALVSAWPRRLLIGSVAT